MQIQPALAAFRNPPTNRTKVLRAPLALGLATLTLASCGGGAGSVSPPLPPDTVFGVPNGNLESAGSEDFRLEYDVHGYHFFWSATPQATRYELYEDPDGPGPLPEAQMGEPVTGTHQFYELADLHKRINASYRLRACNGDSCTFKAATITPDPAKAHFFFKAGGNTAWGPFDVTGYKARISADLKTLVIGIPHAPRSRPATEESAVYVFSRNGTNEAWQQQARLQASNHRAPACNNEAQDYCLSSSFGGQLALSADGNTLAVSATGETSNARGVNGNQANSESLAAGAVYVFTRENGAWSQQAYVKASNTPVQNSAWCNPTYFITQPCNGHYFGTSIALSADGNQLAVSAQGDSSNSIGINADQSAASASNSGAVYTYVRKGSTWAPQAYLKASNTDAGDSFGNFLALSGDGSTLAVSAIFEGSNAEGINGNQQDNSEPSSGAVYVFSQSAGAWSQQAYVKATPKTVGTAPNDYGHYFGQRTALSHDGNTLAVGRFGGGSPGAVHVFTRTNNAWHSQARMQAKVTNSDSDIRNGSFDQALSLSADGNTLATRSNDLSKSYQSSALYFFSRSNGTWSQ